MNPEYSRQVAFWFNFMQVETGSWADETFPKSDLLSILAHMQEELGELIDAVAAEDNEQIEKESADVLLLLFHLNFKAGTDLGLATLKKLEVNKNRTWDTEPNAEGYYKHKEKDNND